MPFLFLCSTLKSPHTSHHQHFVKQEYNIHYRLYLNLMIRQHSDQKSADELYHSSIAQSAFNLHLLNQKAPIIFHSIPRQLNLTHFSASDSVRWPPSAFARVSYGSTFFQNKTRTTPATHTLSIDRALKRCQKLKSTCTNHGARRGGRSPSAGTRPARPPDRTRPPRSASGSSRAPLPAHHSRRRPSSGTAGT